jgi:hypothetical protein
MCSVQSAEPESESAGDSLFGSDVPDSETTLPDESKPAPVVRPAAFRNLRLDSDHSSSSLPVSWHCGADCSQDQAGAET